MFFLIKSARYTHKKKCRWITVQQYVFFHDTVCKIVIWLEETTFSFLRQKVPTKVCDREIFQSRRKSTIETFLVMIVDLCRDLKMMRSHTFVGPFVTTLIFGDKSLRSWLDRRLHFFKNDSFLRFFKNDEIADFGRDFCHDAKMKSTI